MATSSASNLADVTLLYSYRACDVSPALISRPSRIRTLHRHLAYTTWTPRRPQTCFCFLPWLYSGAMWGEVDLYWHTCADVIVINVALAWCYKRTHERKPSRQDVCLLFSGRYHIIMTTSYKYDTAVNVRWRRLELLFLYEELFVYVKCLFKFRKIKHIRCVRLSILLNNINPVSKLINIRLIIFLSVFPEEVFKPHANYYSLHNEDKMWFMSQNLFLKLKYCKSL